MCLLRGLDDYMFLDEQAFRIGIDQGTLLIWIWNSLGFESRWGNLGPTQRGGSRQKRSDIVLGRVGKVVVTCNTKPQILFWYITNFNCFDFF